MERVSVYADLFFQHAFFAVDMILSLAMKAHWANEYEADRFAVENTEAQQKWYQR